MKRYINVSGRLLQDADGNDWPQLAEAELDPKAHATRGMLEYGSIVPAGAKAAPVIPSQNAPRPELIAGPNEGPPPNPSEPSRPSRRVLKES